MSLNIKALSPLISLNRFIFAPDSPDYPDCVRGKKADELLSANAITRYIAQNRHDLGMYHTADADLLSQFLQQLGQNQHDACHPTSFIALKIGRYLGYLLCALHQGHPCQRQLRSEWDATYWVHWQSIRHVYLAGGLARIPMGGFLRQGAQQVLNSEHIPITLHIAPYPDLQPLIGASRLLPADGQTSALVFDFGQTYIKRAIAHYQQDQLVALQILPKLPAPSAQDGESLRRQILAVLGATIHDYRKSPTHISMSVAAYMSADGVHPAQSGQYALMRDWSEHPETVLTQAIQQTYHFLPVVRVVHDGSASALCASKYPDAMVVTMGTALGIGFPQTFARVLPLSSHLDISLAPTIPPA